MKKKYTYLAVFMILGFLAYGQQPASNKGIFKSYEPGYFQNTILKGIDEYQSTVAPPRSKPTFKADPAEFKVPESKNDFKTYWHNDPVSQGNTNTCWCFSANSFLESDIYRTTGKKVRISEMYTVYMEYLERARTWVKTRGDMFFGEGSEANAVTKIWKKYGCVPYDAYTGLLPVQKFYSHEKMFEELKSYTGFVKQNNLWDEEAVVGNFKAILNHYMGEPPVNVTVDGKTYTPKQYLSDYLKISPDDYTDVLSYMQQPYWKQVEYEVPDNWWHNSDYHNIPLDDYMKVLKNSIKQGYTFAIGGDVSEAGFLARESNAAVIPSFDIPSAAIDENARQFRFSNGTTTDDHGMHVVGYKELNGVTWFLVKDSGSGSRTGGKEKNPNFGYYCFHEDYVKLKMMDIMVHKDMMKEYLPRFK